MKLLSLIVAMSTSCLFAQKFTDSLLLHIPTNSNVTDNGPNGYSVSSTGAAYANDSRANPNQALVCNGTTTKTTYATAGTKFQHPFPLTVAVNLNINSITGNYPVFYSADDYTKYAGVWIQVLDGFIYASVGDGAANGTGNRYSIKNSVKLNTTTWYNLCVVFNSANGIDLYLNGVKDVATTSSGGATSMAWNSTANASYGSANTGSGTNIFFNGKLDNLMFWGRALTSAEIKLQRNLLFFGELGATNVDYGPAQITTGKTGTTNDFDRLGKTNAGLSFNGTSDKVSFPANSTYKPTAPFTLSAWVYQVGKTGILPIVATTDHNTNAYFGASLWIENGYPSIYIGDGTCKGATCRKTYISSDSIKLRQWNLVTAVVTDLNTMKLYINGNPVSAGSISGSGSSMDNSPSIAGNIGFLTDAYSVSNKYYSGSIDEVFIANTTFTDADVLSFYSKSVYVKQHPVGVTAASGSNVILTCKGAGTSAIAYQWQKMKWGTGWGNISTETKSDLQFSSLSSTDTGYYRCSVSTGGKTAFSNGAKVNLSPVVGVQHLEKNWNVFPNPANSILNFALGDNRNYKIVIEDLTGKIALSKSVTGSNFSIDISALKTGTYVVSCAGLGSYFQTKLLVIH